MYGIFWWPLDYISSEKPWLRDDGKPLLFQDREDAVLKMRELYRDPDLYKLGFRIAVIPGT